MSADGPLAGLIDLSRRLRGEGRGGDARLILDHLAAQGLADLTTRLERAGLMVEAGDLLGAIADLADLRNAGETGEPLMEEIRRRAVEGVEAFNARLADGDVEGAATFAAALAELIPQSPPLVEAAFSCLATLGREDEALKYAKALLALQPAHANAMAFVVGQSARQAAPRDDIDLAAEQALTNAEGLHPLVQLRDLHDVISRILCTPLTPHRIQQAGTLIDAARRLDVPVEPGTEWEGWFKHYRLLIDALDLEFALGPLPAPAPLEDPEFLGADGEVLDWTGLAARAAGLGAEAVFFVAADEAYVELYARWFALSVLKYADVPPLILIHVIGGRGRLSMSAAKVGIDNPRVVFAGDSFDPEAALRTRCYDAPPKGLIAKPVAHYQSVRFIRLGAVLERLGLPVFVSDIDLILQRGVSDLLARTASDDVVLNENEGNWNAGSRLTANLLHANPTPAALAFFGFLRAYLEWSLAGPEVTRWIDQVALVLARQHLQAQVPSARLGYFDTSSDINNVMYTAYQEHPFRFLSLFHGFDTSSLEGDPRVLGPAD